MKKLALTVVCALILVACGDKHKAENTVRAFLDMNMKSAEYSADFSKLDSTRHITDSVISAMRMTADRKGIYKNDIKFGNVKNYDKIMFMQGKIVIDKDTFAHTFYMTPDLEQVIAFKEN